MSYIDLHDNEIDEDQEPPTIDTEEVIETEDLDYEVVADYFIRHRPFELYNITLGNPSTAGQTDAVLEFLKGYSFELVEKNGKEDYEFSEDNYVGHLENLVRSMMGHLNIVIHLLACKSGYRFPQGHPLMPFMESEASKLICEYFLGSEQMSLDTYITTDYLLDKLQAFYAILPANMRTVLKPTMDRIVEKVYPETDN